jgi:4'-phosphopantetheinyl transferase
VDGDFPRKQSGRVTSGPPCLKQAICYAEGFIQVLFMVSGEPARAAPEVEVWPVWLAAPEAVSRACRALLAPEEARRADRFAFPHLRVLYEVSHGVLRVLLSRYLKRSPHEVGFRFGIAGKPAVCGDTGLRFNLSHSGRLAAYAFTLDCEIGIDIEEVRSMPDLEPIARHYFCPAEAAQLLSLSGEIERREAFFRCWTRKESYVKAIGDGLSIPLDQFQVTLLPDSPARLMHVGGDSAAASEWTLQHLEPAPGYLGALAYRAQARRVVLHSPRTAQEILDLLAGDQAPRSGLRSFEESGRQD